MPRLQKGSIKAHINQENQQQQPLLGLLRMAFASATAVVAIVINALSVCLLSIKATQGHHCLDFLNNSFLS